MAFTAPIFTTLIFVQWEYAKIFGTEFHSYRSRNTKCGYQLVWALQYTMTVTKRIFKKLLHTLGK